MKSQIKDLITVFLIQLVLTFPFYALDAYGLTISNVRVTKVTSTSATVDWLADNISNGRVRYGQTTALGFTQRHDNFVDNHTITIFNGIDSNTQYFFSVESTDLTGNTAIDNNSNSFYSFKTTDINPPPQVTGLKVLSATSSSIYLSWDNLTINDLKNYVVYRNRVPVANSTTNSFNDTGLSPNLDYSYKISAVDNSSNEGPQSDTLIASTSGIDSTAPVISNIDVLTITDTTARVTWLTNENATTVVLYGVNKTDKIKSSSDLETNHSIVIDGLAKNVQYNFSVKSCDSSNNCANSSLQGFLAGKDITLPFFKLSIPKCVNRRVIDITGSTEPFSSVTLFVNNMNTPKRSLSSNEVGASGRFIFSQVQLDQNNIIKIVIVDKSGNKNQKIFEVRIDTEDPIVQLNEIPLLTSKTNVSISGFVNEPVIIKVFMDTNVNESSVPAKITGLNTTKVGQNSVELHWDELKDTDFSHYALYRDGVPIAITKPSNFNLFIDALVDSGKSYTYQVSAVNLFAREGPKSEPLTVTTLKGGVILNIKPAEVDIFEDFRKPLFATNVTGSFNLGVKLNKGDGTYKIKTIVEDCAENSVIIQKDVTLDTKKPEVRITSPPSGAFIFENVAHEIDITGKTKPNARVHLFVDRTPFSFFNRSLEISGLPNEIQDLPEAKLDAKCRFNVAAKSFCGTGADFSVNADSQGNFKFERVDLTTIFGGASRIREVPVTEFKDLGLNPEGQESKRTTLVIIATDQAGQRGFATQAVRIGTCWSGNQSWDVIPLSRYQYPTFLSTERLAEGTETVYFFFNYTYVGRGTNGKITDITLSKACSSQEVSDPRFNISCQIMPSGNNPPRLNPDGTISYSVITLSRFPGMDQFLENDWKSFFRAINKELTFPFRVRIKYEHDVLDDNGQSNRVTEFQTTCEQVTYVVDNSIIDPRKVLPDWLLFDAVDFLQESIKTINQLQEQINKLIDYVAIGCLYSIFARTVFKIYRIWTEFSDEKIFTKMQKANLIKFNLGAEDKNENCKDIMAAIEKGYGSFKLRYLSDADLKKCFPSSDSAWETEAKIYQAQRWTCDRIFGHSSPSGWTETVSDDELYRKVTSEKTCASDFDTKGVKLDVNSCRGLPSKYINVLKNPKDIPADKKCFLISNQNNPNNPEPNNPKGEHIYTIADNQDAALASSKIYKIESYELGFSDSFYAIKINEDRYMTHLPKTCDELCAGESAAVKGQTSSAIVVFNGREFNEFELKGGKIEKKDPTNSQVETKKGLAGCVTVNQCRQWHAAQDPKGGGIIIPGRAEALKGYTVERLGYTKGCFFNGNPNNIGVISETDQNLREECCCVKGKASKFPDIYYKPDETDPKLADTILAQEKVHQSKTNPLEAPKSKPIPRGKEGEQESYSDMEWSYRYSRIGYLGKKYNPNRYITGRDAPACFGQDNLFDAISGKKEILIVDPAKQDSAKLIPCVYLVGVNQWLQRIKVISSAMSTCLIQVRTTGRGDSGVCKELFTQHLCDAVWQGIRFFIDGCAPDYLGPGDSDGREGKFTEDIKPIVKSITQGISEAQREISDDYSNAKLNDLLGAGESDIARKICLFAFGYDWEFNARNLIDAAYSAPFATLVQAVTRSREFLTIDPTTLRPKYEYKASWIINPGCDLERYDIKLACISRQEADKYPNQISCGSIGSSSIAYTGRFPGTGPSPGYNQCDCLELNKEEVHPESFFSETNIKQNSLVDKSRRKVIDADRRYDHLKFILRTDKKIAPGARSNCFPTGYEDGVFYFPITDKTARDIADCTVDLTLGLINCGSGTVFFSKKGIAELVSVTINDKKAEDVKTLDVGDQLKVGARVRKTGQDKCLKVSLSTGEVQPQYELITENRTQDIPGIILTSSLTASGRQPQVSEPTGIKVIGVELRNDKEEAIPVEFYDVNEDATIDLSDTSDDKVKIGNQIKPVKDSIEDGKFTIRGSNYKVQVVGVELPRNNLGQLIKKEIDLGFGKKDYPFRDGIIIIRPPGPTPSADTSQRKIIIVELLHTRENGRGTVADCNDDDKITKPPKEYTITVQPKRVGASEQGPEIGSLTIKYVNDRRDRNIRKGENIIITAKITDRLQVDNVQLVITAPDGKGITVQPNQPSNNDYSFVFDTGNADIAGKYKAKIIAVNKNGKSNEMPAPDFEVQCGDATNGYGICKPLCGLDNSNRITTEFGCKEPLPEVQESGTGFCCRT